MCSYFVGKISLSLTTEFHPVTKHDACALSVRGGRVFRVHCTQNDSVVEL